MSSVPAARWLALPPGSGEDIAVKHPRYLPIYERLLASLRAQEIVLLELGVWHGDSLAMWRDGLPRARIVGVDLAPPAVALGPRVHIETADQTDGAALADVARRHAPHGFDVIIDDASHIGIASARSLQRLYTDHLRPGGIYVIEDWATGYLEGWHDGGAPPEPIAADRIDASDSILYADRSNPVHMPSHDVGMVGLVKRLVDHVAARHSLPDAAPATVRDPLAIESLEIHDGLVVLRKPAAA